MRERNGFQRYFSLSSCSFWSSTFLIGRERTKLISTNTNNSIVDGIGKVRCRIIVSIDWCISDASIAARSYQGEDRIGFLHSTILGKPTGTFWEVPHQSILDQGNDAGEAKHDSPTGIVADANRD
jgi:hypothetical protein